MAMLERTGLENLANNGPRLLFADHHEQIEKSCDALRTAIYADDPLVLAERYRAFEHAMLEHMAAEEEHILPAYAADAPEDAAAIRATHDELRQQLFRIGVDVELHSVRAAALEQLVKTLRAHAALEDVRMYPWAQVHLPARTKRELFKRIGRSLRRLASTRVTSHG
jgi:hypothetical protein